ncbi:MAG: hypothetical protein K0S14_3225 [Thermomicrobiales bacterium]|jgi:hypothetical protein|nr:hypothetical protein [Thermomicrobiales bacterium]
MPRLQMSRGWHNSCATTAKTGMSKGETARAVAETRKMVATAWKVAEH